MIHPTFSYEKPGVFFSRNKSNNMIKYTPYVILLYRKIRSYKVKKYECFRKFGE